MVERPALQAIGQVLLVDPGARVIVRVLVLAVVLGPGTMAVAQMVGDGSHGPVTHFAQRRVDPRLGRVALGGKRNVSRSLGKVDASFRITDDLS